MSPFLSAVEAYRDVGLAVIPTAGQTKNPTVKNWTRFASILPSEEDVRTWKNQYGNANVYLPTWQAVGNMRLVAIDVDNDEYVPAIKAILWDGRSGARVAKRGKKGLTIFVLASATDEFGGKVAAKRFGAPDVEVLAENCGTVLPPSIHPDTKKQYEWIGGSLLDTKLSSLPIISWSFMDEVAALVGGDYELFKAMNEASAASQGGGRDNALTAASMSMAKRGWTKEQVKARLYFAYVAADQRAGETTPVEQIRERVMHWIGSAFDKCEEGAGRKNSRLKSGTRHRRSARWRRR